LGLEKIAESLIEQRPTEFEESLQQRKEQIERWGVVALSAFGIGVLSIPAYHIVKMMLEGRMLAGVGYLALMVLMACGLLAAILFAKAKSLDEAKAKGRIAQSEPSVQADTTAKLLAPHDDLDLMPSVTEATTELLFAEKQTTDKKS
jgi:hypothetical protein